MKPIFNYADIVRVRLRTNPGLRPGARAWIVGVFEIRDEPYFDQFPAGVVYTIEFEDGASVDIHEMDIEPDRPKDKRNPG